MIDLRLVAVLAVVTLGGCATPAAERSDLGAGDARVSDALAGDAAPSIAGRSFGPFEAWARPIEDYIAVGKATFGDNFDASINELFPFGGRLWIGYGDATANLGTYAPIELRAFADAVDPTAKAFVVDGAGQGADQTAPTQSGEEQIDRYRGCDGRLWQAGIDSTDADELWTQERTTPPAISGNVYRLEGATWRKFRSVAGGEHVHDVACFKGAVYAVGSGSKDRPEWESGQIFRYLWRSADLGQTFEVAERVAHPAPGKGDTRWVDLLPTQGTLYLFGYVSTFTPNTSVVANASTQDGVTVTELAAGSPLARIAGFGSTPLPDGSGLLTGLDLDARRFAIWRVGAQGAVQKLDAFAGRTVIDVHVETTTNEIVFLTRDSDAYPAPTTTTRSLKVHVAPVAHPEAPVEVAAHASSVGIYAVAFFDGALLLGTADGQVLRALPGN